MVKIGIMYILLCAYLLNFINCTPEYPIDDNSYSDPSYLAEPEWLLENLTNSDILIIDARGTPTDSSLYMSGHIPGAIRGTWQQFSAFSSSTTEPGYAVLMSTSELSTQLSAIGITANKTVVVYTDNMNLWGEDGRLVWMLRMAGVTNAKILNGGITYWKDLGYITSTAHVQPTPSTFTITSLDESFIVSSNYLSNNLNNVIILDSRSQAEYNGDTTSYGPNGHGGYGEKSFGHIPGAIYAPFRNVFNINGTLKSQKDLEALFREYGIESKNDIIVPYCTGGVRAALSAIVLSIAGYSNVKNYDDSFWGWTARDLPVETY
jgi:thiosulfate/3-mercaptopyruvate sulfurtransferase